MSYSQEESDLLRENNVLKGQLAAQAALSAKLREALVNARWAKENGREFCQGCGRKPDFVCADNCPIKIALSLAPSEAEEAAKRELKECRGLLVNGIRSVKMLQANCDALALEVKEAREALELIGSSTPETTHLSKLVAQAFLSRSPGDWVERVEVMQEIIKAAREQRGSVSIALERALDALWTLDGQPEEG